jgi:plastocyanin
MSPDGGPTRSDDVDRATEALRESPIPPGPPAHLVDATLAAVRRGPLGAAMPHRPETTYFQRIRTVNLIAKVAAAFVLAACGAAVLILVTRGTGQSPRADRKRIEVSSPVEPPGPPSETLTNLVRGTDGAPAQPVKATAPAIAQQGNPAGPPPAPNEHPIAPENSRVPAPVAGVRDGAITGIVRLDGKAPPRRPITNMTAVKDCAALHPDPPLDETVVADDAGNLANVVVFLTGANLPHGPMAKEPVVLEQKGCQYVPHVLDITVGQTVVAKNDDGFLHNVHTLPEANEPSNMAQPTKQTDKLKAIKSPELFKVKCDVHPWMSAWIYAFDHPYHSATAEDGSFEIRTDGLADGQYAIVAWHEKYKQSTPQMVTIKGGKPDKPVTFTFKP